jgi:hypothetical protein
MISLGALYSVETSDNFKALGIDVQFRKSGPEGIGTPWEPKPSDHADLIGFHDTARGHNIEGYLLKETLDGFIWQRQEYDPETKQSVNDGELAFRVLTLERFKEEFLPKAVGPLPDFNSTEDLWEWYRRRYADAGGDYY